MGSELGACGCGRGKRSRRACISTIIFLSIGTVLGILAAVGVYVVAPALAKRAIEGTTLQFKSMNLTAPHSGVVGRRHRGAWDALFTAATGEGVDGGLEGRIRQVKSSLALQQSLRGHAVAGAGQAAASAYGAGSSGTDSTRSDDGSVAASGGSGEDSFDDADDGPGFTLNAHLLLGGFDISGRLAGETCGAQLLEDVVSCKQF